MRIGIACEDVSHFWVTTRLARGAALQAHPWLADTFDSFVEWCGSREGDPWHSVSKTDVYDVSPIDIDGVVIRSQGFIGGERLLPEAGMWRKVLLLFANAHPRPDVVILVRDSDGDMRRLNGINQVRYGLPWPFPIVVAFAEPEIEAWLVCGFEPQGAEELEALESVCTELSFDPTRDSHRLTASPNDAARDAKRVLNVLCQRSRTREEQCLENGELIMERGSANGLTAFMTEVADLLVPLFGGRAR